MFITSGFNPICKNMLMFSFTKPPTVWVTCAAFLCFYSFRKGLFFIRRIPASCRRWSLVMIIFIFLKVFSHVLFYLHRFLFAILPHTRGLLVLQSAFSFFLLFRTSFYVSSICKDNRSVHQMIFHTFI